MNSSSATARDCGWVQVTYAAATLRPAWPRFLPDARVSGTPEAATAQFCTDAADDSQRLTGVVMKRKSYTEREPEPTCRRHVQTKLF